MFEVVALGLGVAAAGRERPEPELGPGEVVLFRARPRKSILRYALSLGTWELVRKSTYFVVTQRRVLVERGVFRRHLHSIPLKGIVDIDVVAGPWEGVVRISERGTAPSSASEVIGPLRAPAARLLATTMTRAIAASDRPRRRIRHA